MTDADLARRLAAVQERIAAAARAAGRTADAVALLAVSKTHPAADVRAAYALGQRAFGENRVQELVAKAPELADLTELRWHMIGSLQTNKVRDLLCVPGFALLHSLDRPKLAAALQRELAPAGRRLSVLLQIHATDEPQKHGCPPQDAAALLQFVGRECPALQVEGLMGMGPLDGDPAPAFRRVAGLAAELRAASGLPLPTLSLGMSGDLEVAVACGSTLVRIGTDVFGARG
ncbi:MAG: YggS family pyridoxal phosphate-dependent enzyme [Planctomycetota bacterium]